MDVAEHVISCTTAAVRRVGSIKGLSIDRRLRQCVIG
jgi:hypothetical protein